MVMMKIKAKEDLKNGVVPTDKKKKKTPPTSSSSSSSSSSSLSVLNSKTVRLLSDIEGGVLSEGSIALKLSQAVDR